MDNMKTIFQKWSRTIYLCTQMKSSWDNNYLDALYMVTFTQCPVDVLDRYTVDLQWNMFTEPD